MGRFWARAVQTADRGVAFGLLWFGLDVDPYSPYILICSIGLHMIRTVLSILAVMLTYIWTVWHILSVMLKKC